jgi:hypothetical protein
LRISATALATFIGTLLGSAAVFPLIVTQAGALCEISGRDVVRGRIAPSQGGMA